MTNEPLSPVDRAALTTAIASAVLSTPTGLSTALQEGVPGAYLRLVDASRTAADETTRLLREAVAGARRAEHSWDAIGQVLGVSRQAAQQRFGTTIGAPAGCTSPGAYYKRRLDIPAMTAD